MGLEFAGPLDPLVALGKVARRIVLALGPNGCLEELRLGVGRQTGQSVRKGTPKL